MNPKDESAVVLTVDAEEWFHVPGSAAYADESSWDGLPAAFPRAMERTLGFLEEGGWKATFFVLGWLAKRYPSEVRAIAMAGHEVACHGLEHGLVTGMSPSRFRADVSAAKSLLEDLTGLAVRGFRAPRWSMPRSSWPYEALASEGFAYSSSRLCIAGLGAGNPEPATIEGVREIPVLSSGWGWMAWPAGGTVAIRVASLKRLEKARDRVLARGRPAVYWFHPWELLADAPRVGGGVLFRWSRYARLERLPERLNALVPPGERSFDALLAGHLDPE